MPRRVIRIKRIAPDTRSYILEQHPRQPRAQVRIWLPSLKTYRRMSIPHSLRDDAGRRAPSRIVAACTHADHLITTHPHLQDAPVLPVAALGSALDFACEEVTTRKRERGSAQNAEWRRARAEVLAVLPASMRADDVSGSHVALIARSVLARRISGASVVEWADALLAHFPDNRLTSDVQALGVAVERALEQQQRYKCAASASGSRRVTLSWPIRTVELLRAMMRHAAERGDRCFRQLASFVVPRGLDEELKTYIEAWSASVDSDQFRPQRTAQEARALMRMITDPRYHMWQIVASLTNGARAHTLRASEIRSEGDTVLVYCQRREKYAHRKAWHALGAPEAAALQALLTGPYAELEHARAAGGGGDYALIGDTRWDGTRLFHITDPHLPAAVAPEALVDPRTWLSLMLGAEGRSGQVLRVMRSDIKVEARLNQLLLHVPGRGKKTGTWLLLARTQQLALAFAMRAGYLALLERAYQGGTLRDYPLFPQGPLADGRAPVPPLPRHGTVPRDVDVRPAPSALAPMNDRVLNDWARKLEALLGLPRVEGEGLYGWRRAFVTLFNPWEPNARVKDLLTAHATIRDVQHGSTRTQVYLDPLDIPVLLAGQRLLEHVRTAFIRTGAAPDGTTNDPFASGEREDRDTGP